MNLNKLMKQAQKMQEQMSKAQAELEGKTVEVQAAGGKVTVVANGAGDGVIRWWLDGALVGDYTKVRYPHDTGFIEYQISPTWGGIGDVKRETDYYRFNRSYISSR